MIGSISIKNYRSIQDLTIDLRYAEGKAPNGWKDSAWLPFVGDDMVGRYAPILAIYGANASGKTNVLKALATLQNVLSMGIEGNYHPNRLLLECQKAPTVFTVVMNLAGESYTYEIAYDKYHILHERLCNGKQVCLIHVEDGILEEVNLDNASYSLERLSEIPRVECKDANGLQTKSLAYRLFKGYAGLSKIINAVVSEIVDRNTVYDGNEIIVSRAIDRLVSSGSAQDIQTAFNKILAYLKKFDIHINTMKLSRQAVPQATFEKYAKEFSDKSVFLRSGADGEQVTVEQITSFHERADGVLEPFHFYSEESQGTKLLAGLIGIVLDALETGGRLFIDELDRSLHPLLLVQLVRMFKAKKLNTKNAQLVFTLHETSLLEDPLLRLSEVGILNNNLYTGTKLLRLIDYHIEDKSVRNVHNFRKRYLEGLYAGIPEPIL